MNIYYLSKGVRGMEYNFTDPYEIARFIKESKKSTPVKAYVKGDLKDCNFENVDCFGEGSFYVLFGDSADINNFLDANKEKIHNYRLESDRRNSAIPMLDTRSINARIEPGAIIRDRVSIGNNAVIMMGAVINIGAEIGDETMVDMNAVVGVIGANAVILEGVKIGNHSVVAAGAIVTTDVPENVVVAGSPAKIIKHVDDKTKSKTEILADLRK